MKLKRNKELASRNTKREYLLSGYVFCQHCERRYTAHYKGRNSYYNCPKCKDNSLNTKYPEPVIWNKIEEVLSKPDVVLGSVDSIRDKANNANCYQGELDRIESKLRHFTKEKDRIWKAFEITGDEAKFTRDMKNLMSKIEDTDKRKAELINKIELAEKSSYDLLSIKDYCNIVSQNLGKLDFSEKRKALEALGVRVMVSKDEIRLDGEIPIVFTQCA